MNAKQIIRELLDRLPDDCTIEDVFYHLYVLQRESQGLNDVESDLDLRAEILDRDPRRRWLLRGE